MTPFEREIRRQRRRIIAIERNGASALLSTYQAIHRRLEREIAAVTQLITDREASGQPVSVSWLHRLQRYEKLLMQVEVETLGFAQRALDIIRTGQNEALIYAPKETQTLALGALGVAPAEAVQHISIGWDVLPDDVLRTFVGRASDGKPLGDLLAEIAPGAVSKVRDTLAYGVATGKPVRLIAQDFAKASGATLTRSLVIARNETISAYRAAGLESYRANDDVVRGWTWQATVDRRTCASCWAQNGSEHSLAETLDSHTCCRCSMIPRTATWRELGFDIPDRRPTIRGGAEVFAEQPREVQLAVLGRSKYEAYAQGDIALQDLVEHTEHPRWGAGTREASLRRALGNARKRDLIAA